MSEFQPCPNDHDEESMTYRDDGSRVCLACRDLYYARNRIQGRNVTRTPQGAHRDAARR